MSDDAQQQQEAAQQPASGAPAPQATPTPQAPQQPELEASRVARLEDELKQARAEAGKSRVNAKQAAADEARQDTLAKVLGALGLEQDGTRKVTLDDVTSQLEQAKQQQREAHLELAVYRQSAALNANPDALLDSRAFLTAAADLDPSDAEAVKAAIKQAVTTNPTLAARVAGKSGAEYSGSVPGATSAATQAAPGQARLAAAYAENTR